jgi:hypothetical protein
MHTGNGDHEPKVVLTQVVIGLRLLLEGLEKLPPGH